MLKHHLKRLPVINEQGLLVGMLSRLDVFNTITKHAPKWAALEERKVEVTNITSLKDIMQREMHAVRPDTPVTEVIEMICGDAIQRVAVEDATVDEAIRLMAGKGLKRLPVVDEQGVFKGMISRDSVLRSVIK